MRRFMWFFLLYPLLELAVLIKVGSLIGVFATLLLVIGSSLLGGALLRVVGITTALRAREALGRGEPPEREVLDGLMMGLGAGLLLLPGLLNDLFALLCVLPWTRHWLIQRLLANSRAQAERQRAFADQPEVARSEQGPRVIEGEYERRDS
jgi:UPF0716 protein FxsA